MSGRNREESCHWSRTVYQPRGAGIIMICRQVIDAILQRHLTPKAEPPTDDVTALPTSRSKRRARTHAPIRFIIIIIWDLILLPPITSPIGTVSGDANSRPAWRTPGRGGGGRTVVPFAPETGRHWRGVGGRGRQKRLGLIWFGAGEGWNGAGGAQCTKRPIRC